MTLEEFQWNASSRGFRVVDNVAMGDYYGRTCIFPFSITVNGKKNDVYYMDIRTEKTVSNAQYKDMRKQLKPMGAIVNTLLPGVRFIPNNKTPDMLGACLNALNFIIPYLEGSGHIAPAFCPYCKQGMMDAEAHVNGFLVPVHKACVENNTYQSYQAIQKNETTGSNRLLGILGAMLGALVGSIPALLLIVFLNMVSAWLYALVAICSYYGYKLFKGKMDKWVVLIVIICTLLAPFFVEQVQFFFYYHTYTGTWLPPHQSIALYFEVMSFGDMMADLAMPLLFTGLGILFSLGIIRQNNATEQKGLDFTLRSLFVRSQQVQQNPQAQQNQQGQQ